MRGVILSALVAPLVSRIREPAGRGLLGLAATIAAVALPPVIRPTNVERRRASAAAQRENNELVHPRGRDENWTPASASTTVRAYWLSIRRLYMRVQASTWTLLRFFRRPDLQERLEPRDFWPCLSSFSGGAPSRNRVRVDVALPAISSSMLGGRSHEPCGGRVVLAPPHRLERRSLLAR